MSEVNSMCYGDGAQTFPYSSPTTRLWAGTTAYPGLVWIGKNPYRMWRIEHFPLSMYKQILDNEVEIW